MDGKTEDKLFAPGYGEFYTADGPDVEALALAVPTDALTGATPPDLATLESEAWRSFDSAGSGDWTAASGSVDAMAAAWASYGSGDVPRLVAPKMSQALAVVAAAVRDHAVTPSRQAALQVAQLALDLQLRYRPAVEVNRARMGLWAAQLLIDAAARDAGAVRGDVFTLVYVRDRLLGSIDAADLTRINTTLQDLQVGATDHDFAAVTTGAMQLRAMLAAAT
jgi:hypothetical protein